MKQIVKFLIIIGLVSFASSCVEDLQTDIVNEEASKVAFIIEDFKPADATKSALQLSDMSFQWSEDDVVGVFPSAGYQAIFPMESGAGSNVAVFDGGGWGLKSEATYYAYYPFNKENFESMDMREKVPYSYEGQEVCFADENGVVNLSKYDFMASGASKVENDNVSFTFKHLGALCRISFDSPATTSYSRVVISADNAVFPMSGIYDATDKDTDGVVMLESDSVLKNHIELSFPASYRVFAAGDKIELYFLMPPVDLSGIALKMKLEANDGDYESILAGSNILAGNSYSWTAEFETYQPPMDMETANCYVISTVGTYSIPTVKGNSVYYVGSVASAEVLWETFGTDVTPNVGDLISKVSYADNMITFSTSDTFKEGNALIAAKDSDGNILWSWHIWLTDQPKDQVYCNNAGTMMDRNLGATSATPGDVGALGLLYQWGRKDPFLGSSSISSNSNISKATLTSWPTTVSTESEGSIRYATAHPTTFITRNMNNLDWWYSSDLDGSNNTRWSSTKTIFDPCPAGYRVPDGGSTGVWATAFGVSSDFDEGAFDPTNMGFNFGKSDTYKYLTEETICWYPAAGYKSGNDSLLHALGKYGYYCSCTSIKNWGAFFYFYKEGKVYPLKDFNLANARPVRCLKE